MSLESITGAFKGKAITPLFVIGLCGCVFEFIVWLAYSGTNGVNQLIFTCFLVGFPLLVFFQIMYILIYKPINMYSPKDFGDSTSIREFKEAMSDAEIFANEHVKRLKMLEVEAVRTSNELTSLKTRLDCSAEELSGVVSMAKIQASELDVFVKKTSEDLVEKINQAKSQAIAMARNMHYLGF